MSKSGSGGRALGVRGGHGLSASAPRGSIKLKDGMEHRSLQPNFVAVNSELLFAVIWRVHIKLCVKGQGARLPAGRWRGREAASQPPLDGLLQQQVQKGRPPT